MLGMIRHRGPDEFGLYLDERAALGSARLSIVDLAGGQQPIGNEDESLWIVYNGEIFNHIELRRDLEARGHRFRTHSDTEVLLHGYEEYGPEVLAKLNGQFALAIWDSRKRKLFLARDRLGVRPLFYAIAGGALLFGSEIKALLAEGRLSARINAAVLDQVFTFWSPLSPNTVFEGIQELPPGRFMTVEDGQISIQTYWSLTFPDRADTERKLSKPEEEDLLAAFGALLEDAVRLRLRADVPVGAYLSGGLDSSIIAALVHTEVGERLSTFSIAFGDAQFDESRHQLAMARHLGTDHKVRHVSHADIGRVFPEVVWHTETPLMRTSPAPMFLLSKQVRDQRFKVVLTGEGADEFLCGYDLFKEAKVRRFWAAQPHSAWRPLLLKRLYPDIGGLAASGTAMLAAFFGEDLADVEDPAYSHRVRWRNNRRATRFFTDGVLAQGAQNVGEAARAVALPPEFRAWGPLQRAQYIESSVFLSQYLLCSQGDRMAMAHSVEGRFPFLDYRLVEFCGALPSSMKLRVLSEKHLLRRFARGRIPRAILDRPKRPYRAPIHRCFFGQAEPEYVRELLSPEALRKAGWFKPERVAALVSRLRQDKPVGETDDMALAGILSTQLVQHRFVDHFQRSAPVGDGDRVKLVHGGAREILMFP